MSEKAPKNHNKLRKSAIAIGSTILAFGAITSTAEAATTAPRYVAEVAASQDKMLMPANQEIPKNVADIMAHNTVYIPEFGCSGFLLRNQADIAIGVMTAEHCGLQNKTEDRILGTDGMYYMLDRHAPITLQTGDDSKEMHAVGTVNTFILPPSTDANMDIALGIVTQPDGTMATPKEVLATYKANRLNNDAVNSLQFGDTLYNSGFPVDQQNPNLTRQSFAMTYLATETNELIGDGDTRTIVWAAVTKNQNGAICSPGDSGSAIFKMINSKPRIVGTMSAYIDLVENNPKSGSRQSAQQIQDQKNFFSAKHGINLSDPNIAALCGIAYEAPMVDKAGSLVKIVGSRNSIPGYDGPANAEDAPRYYAEQFHNPSKPVPILHGRIKLYDQSPSGETEAFWINNPVVYSGLEGVYVGYQDPGDSNNIVIMNYLSELLIYSSDKQPNMKPTITMHAHTGFTTKSGGTFGQFNPYTQHDTAIYSLFFEDGKPVIQHANTDIINGK